MATIITPELWVSSAYRDPYCHPARVRNSFCVRYQDLSPMGFEPAISRFVVSRLIHWATETADHMLVSGVHFEKYFWYRIPCRSWWWLLVGWDGVSWNASCEWKMSFRWMRFHTSNHDHGPRLKKIFWKVVLDATIMIGSSCGAMDIRCPKIKEPLFPVTFQWETTFVTRRGSPSEGPTFGFKSRFEKVKVPGKL